MPHGADAPATKKDISMLMEELGKMYRAQEQWKEELKRHFDVAVENIRHDLVSANREEIDVLKDRSKGHEKRIVRLERATGVVA